MKVVRRDDDGDAAALDEMAEDDKDGVLGADGGGGALDYDQYYPTLLPLRAPDRERAAMMLATGDSPDTAAAEVRRCCGTARPEQQSNKLQILGCCASAPVLLYQRQRERKVRTASRRSIRLLARPRQATCCVVCLTRA